MGATAPLSQMTSTRIELPAGRIARLADMSDVAELLFPGNRNQQHAFLVLWFSLKWADHHLVPNLADAARAHGVTPRTFERVRAKCRRLGLIERISRFNPRFASREGWILSPRFEHVLHRLADWVAALRSRANGSQEKDRLMIDLADARRTARPIRRIARRNEVDLHGP